MANTYEGNGDYSSYAEEESEYSKQRKMASSGPHNGDNSHSDLHHHNPNTNMNPAENNYLNEKANDYIRDCLNEKSRMDRKFPIAEKLLDAEIEKVQTTGRLPSREQKYADIYREKPLRVSQKVLVPIREHPKFNFVGKLLGPKGNSLRRLQEETMCKMTVLGRNSMRDRVKEEELRNSKDPKYSHLNSDLHVEISTVAPPAEAYARVAYAMAELRKYLIPDSNDVIRQEQLRELMDSTHISEEQKALNFNKKIPQFQTATGGGGGGAGATVGILTGGPGAGVAALGASCANSLSNQTKNTTPYRTTGQNATASSSATYSKNNIAPKQKVMSILEKARSAMEETYGFTSRRGYDDSTQYDHHQAPHSYDTYAAYPGHAPQPPVAHNPHGPQTTGVGIGNINTARTPYETVEYETNDYNRRDYYQNPTASSTAGYGATGIQPPNNGGINPNQNQNRSHVNRLRYPSISANSTNSSTSLKASNISHIKTASVEIVSGFTDTESAPCTTLALTTTSCNQNMNPSLRTMTIPTQNFPPSLSQSQSSLAALNNNNDTNKTTNTVNFSNQNHSNLKNATLATSLSLVSDAETAIPNLNNNHQNMNSSKTILTSTTSSSISSQRSSTTASLLFVSPANPSRTLHVGKLPFLPVQFI